MRAANSGLLAIQVQANRTRGDSKRYPFVKVLHTDDNDFDTSHIAAGDAG